MKRLLCLILILPAACSKQNDGGSSNSPPPSSGSSGSISNNPTKEAEVKREKPKEEDIKIDVKKDPLAYKIYEFPGGSIAKFEDWQVAQAPSDANWLIVDTWPNGRQTDFGLRIAVGTPSKQEIDNFFTLGPQLVRQFLQGFQRVGEQKKCKFGGDEAMIEEYEGSPQGKKIAARVVYVKKKDIAVGVMGLGSETGFKEFGRSIEIVAQSITFKESPLEPALVGTWALEKYHSSGTGDYKFSSSTSRYLTLYPNGTFTDSTNTFAMDRNPRTEGTAMVEGKDRGRVVKRGDTLTLHYDDGKSITYDYKLEGGGGLMLNGSLYLKQ